MTARAKILFVDDDRDFLTGKRAYLEAHGCEVMTCESGDEARRALTAFSPDIIFVDLMMEHVDSGFRLAYHLRADERLKVVPIVMLSGVAAATGRRFDDEGAELREWSRLDQFVDKPVTGKQVLDIIEARVPNRGAA
jgi:CheY-like chemotaxis protein